MNRNIFIICLSANALLGINFSFASSIGINMDFDSIFDNASTEQGKYDMIPSYKGTNIPEANINPNDISSQASIEIQNNETGSLINNSFSTRPKYDTSQLGNVVRNSEKSSKNSKVLADRNYSDPNGQIEYRICYRYYGSNNYKNNTYNKYCYNNLKLKCTAYESGCKTSGLELASLQSDLDWFYDNSGVLTIGKKNEIKSHWTNDCLIIDKVIEFNVSNLELVEVFSLARAIFSDYISITLNDKLVYVGPDDGTQLIVSGHSVNDGKNIKYCGSFYDFWPFYWNTYYERKNTIWNQYLGRNLIPFLRVGKNTLRMRIVFTRKGQGSMEFMLKNKCCREHAEEWVETCDNDRKEDKCYLIEKICTKKDQIVKLDGRHFFKKCSVYRQVYRCKTYDSCFNYADDCDKINTTGCKLETREYVDSSKELEKFTYRCLNPGTVQNINNKKIQCIDGECNNLESTQDNTQDMMDTLVILSTLNESVKTIKSDDKTMLNGENLECRKSTSAALSFLDCCGDGNWGNSIGFACNSEEKKLKGKRNRNDCIYVGSYCSQKIDLKIGKICITRKRSYCCYDNRFSKIMAGATRQQGLQTWGSARNTNCRGIPLDRLQNLDFSKIDLRELYDDIKSGIDRTKISNKIQQTLNNLKNANE